MNNINKITTLFIVLGIASSVWMACNKETDGKFGIFTVIDENTIEMNGDIRRSTLRHFNNLIDKHSNIKVININAVPGSRDDETNLKLSKKVHDLNISTHLMDNGEIASGGVDFFLAGKNRSKGDNTQIGVHSWAGDGSTAVDFPRGHENHLPYINYYVSVGFSQKEAEDFYYFTINAAPAESIHWMTDAEIEKYKIVNR